MLLLMLVVQCGCVSWRQVEFDSVLQAELSLLYQPPVESGSVLLNLQQHRRNVKRKLLPQATSK